MKILVTAGNTQTPVDQVRCITNVFSGRTGGGIALAAQARGHDVVFLTSHPEVVAGRVNPHGGSFATRVYQTFDDLHALMQQAFAEDVFDATVHAAAVSDYRLSGVFAPEEVAVPAGIAPRLVDVSAGKVKSHYSELWFRLVPTPKLVDKIRSEWGFEGILAKFKLEVGVDEASLMEIAEASRRHSQADMIVANTFEGMHDWAMLGDERGYVRMARRSLAEGLLLRIERSFAARSTRTACLTS